MKPTVITTGPGVIIATATHKRPKRTQIVAYCRGLYGAQSDAAVALLAKRGFKAKRLEFGLPDWRALGLPVGVVKSEPRTKQPGAKAPTRMKRVN